MTDLEKVKDDLDFAIEYLNNQKNGVIGIEALKGLINAQAKLNLLNIPVVIVSDFCECDGVQDLHAMTGECRKCGKECDY
jgi:hypothetical protein